MSRQVIQLHTIQQWFSVDPTVRSVILQNIKLKDRLYRFLMNKTKGIPLVEAKWVRCSKCADSPHPGYVLLEPRYDGIHPSQLAHACMLKVYNEMVGIDQQEKIEPRLQLIFDLGHAVHHMFQTYGLNGAWGKQYSPEVTISEEHQELAATLMLEGHADAENVLVIDDIPNSPYIYEVGLVHEYKTIKTENFNKLTRPKPEHKQQAMIYSAALNRPVVVYLYMSKNDSNLADFPVEFDFNLWQQLEGKARLLVDHYKKASPPPAEVGFHCQECGFAYQCEPYKATALKRRKA
jgi:CRISPR/Cas system-associated exonuclease Cas4 (RecB family)